MTSKIVTWLLIAGGVVALLFALSLFFSLPAWLTFIVGIGVGYSVPSLVKLVLDKSKKSGRKAYSKARAYR